jgi:hypothetical protein
MAANIGKIYHYLNRLHGKSLLGGTTEFAHADQRIEAALSTEFTMEFNDGKLALHLEIYMT